MKPPLVRLAQRLGPTPTIGEHIATEVELCLSNATTYRERFASRLALRGPIAAQRLPWIALVDALIAARAAVEIDWREEPTAVRSALKRLADPLPKVRVPSSATAAEALDLFARAFASLSPSARPLVLLDLESDSDAVALVSGEGLEELVALAREAGQRIVPLPRPAPPPAPLPATPLAIGPRWAKLLDATDEWSRDTDGVLWRLLKNPAALDAIYAARDDAPAVDHALIDAVVELYTAPSPATAIEGLAPQPDRGLPDCGASASLALRALRYYHFATPEAARAKLDAAALLCERVSAGDGAFPAESEAAARLAESLVIWSEDAANQLLTLPSSSRERLARAADALLRAVWADRNPHVRREDHAYELAKVVGDAATAGLIEREAPRVDGAIESWPARQALEWIGRREATRRDGA